MVLYVISGETVAVLDGGGQSVADARLAADADFARMVRLRVIGDRSCRRAGRGFIVSGIIFVAGFDADVVSHVVAGELIGCARLSANRLAVAQPLVLHVSGYAVVIGNRCGQGLSDFCFTTDADFAFVVGLRRRIWCRGIGNGSSGFAQRVFVMSGVVFVGRTHGDFVSRVVTGKGVGAACLSADRLAVS